MYDSLPLHDGCARTEKITRVIFSLSLILLLLILPLGFIHEKAGRIAFYNCSYLCGAGILLNFKSIRSTLFSAKIILPGLLLAAMYSTWSLVVSFNIVPNVDNGLLFTPAKRWFLASLIALFTLWGVKNKLVNKELLFKLTWISLSAAFILSSVYGIWQHISGVDRIVLGINRATMTAYAYSAMALAMMTMLNQIKSLPVRFSAIILTCLLSIYIILLTETRSAMLIHTLLSIAIMLSALWRGKVIKPLPLVAILLAFFVVALLSKNIILSRFETTQQEISLFTKGDDHTSLGSRFSLWQSGIVAIKQHPFGETQTTRNTILRSWLGVNHPNSFALEYIDVHLHNEFIQYASLFGVFGVLILLFFFIKLIFDNGTKGIFDNPVSIVALSALLYGMTDVVLTSIEYIALLSTLILLASVNSIEKIRD
ncbi:O-antigen ligase family protein [Erwinia phyllosphaerae]|uniref:O-antigen ligase family protein n=1 Tax=Erwinia phyllosphaerae TaxID=2853256 RepID=UPI001FEDAD3E|nr:O-antigen ligase family protein [Erwinia phyllosphaerae]MBV4367934.1 O-antigen ligase family protein [Erwinia phyllosphaerae]